MIKSTGLSALVGSHCFLMCPAAKLSLTRNIKHYLPLIL